MSLGEDQRPSWRRDYDLVEGPIDRRAVRRPLSAFIAALTVVAAAVLIGAAFSTGGGR